MGKKYLCLQDFEPIAKKGGPSFAFKTFMLDSRRLPNTVPLPLDGEMLRFLLAREQDVLQRQPQEIAVLNQVGELYRVITLGARRDLDALLASFASRGLSNRIQLNRDTLTEVDVVTGQQYLGPYTAILQIGATAFPLPE